MSFDIRTLLVAVALSTAFCAGARLLLWRMHPTIPGLGRWALAGGFAVLIFVMIFSYGRFQWEPFLVFAQLFVILGLAFVWDGFRRFIDKTPVTLTVKTIAAVLLLVWISFAFIMESKGIQALGNAVIVSILSGLIAWDLITANKFNSPSMRVTGWLYALNASIFLLRVIFVDQAPQPVDPIDPAGVTAVMLLWTLCLTVAATLGMVLMTSERLQFDLDYQANHDPLTGALNRRSFSILSQNIMARCQRNKIPLSIFILDLDHFKDINDVHGHDAGDSILCRLVDTAKRTLRGEDIFCRFGGEEFVAVLPGASAQESRVIAERLRKRFAEGRNIDLFQDMQVTVSIGIAELIADETFDSFLQRADIALYKAKKNGRDCCEIASGYSEAIQVRA